MKFSENVGNRQMNKWLNFGGDRDHRLDTGIVFFRIRHYWEIQKVVSGHKLICCCIQSFIHTDSPDGGSSYDYISVPISTLDRLALAEVCTVPVLLALKIRTYFSIRKQKNNTLRFANISLLILQSWGKQKLNQWAIQLRIHQTRNRIA